MRIPPITVTAACALLSAVHPQEPALHGVPADAANVMVVRDVKPHVDALLKSELVRDLLASTGTIQQELFGTQVDAVKIERLLALFWSYVPVRVEAIATNELTASIARALQAATAILIGEARIARGVDPADLAGLHTAIREALRGLVVPAGIVRLELRDARTTERWFDSLADAIEGMAPDPGVQCEFGDDFIAIAVAPFLVQQGTLSRSLQRLGVDPSPFAGLTIRARLERAENRLTLRLGDFEPADVPPAALGELWRSDGDQLAYARLDARVGLEIAADTLALLVDCDDELEDPRVLSMQGFVLQMLDLVPQTTVALDLGNDCRFTVLADTGEDFDASDLEVPAEEVIRAIDPDVGPFSLIALPFDVVCANATVELQVRTMQRAPRWGGMERMAAVDRFADLFEFIEGEESAVFATGTAVVSRGAILRGLSWRLADGTEGVVRDLPFGAFALVGKAESADAAREFVDRVVELTCRVLGVSSQQALIDADLGLGVPARHLAWQRWAPEVTALDADFDPHHVQLDDVMILSTDPGLTKVILARLRAETQPALPVANPIEWTLWRGEHIAAVIEGIGPWLRAFPLAADQAELRTADKVCAALAAVGRAVDAVEWLTVVEHGGRVRRTATLKLRGPTGDAKTGK